MCKRIFGVVCAIAAWPLLLAMSYDRRARSSDDGFAGFDDDDPGVDVDGDPS